MPRATVCSWISPRSLPGALEQFTQRAQPRFRVRPGDMTTKPDGIAGQLTLEENNG
ncbi:hypothetical protein LNP25_13075 [Klebsiella variicola subsp. variicola]|nr:hypothetical protein [Klebsiella variicola subsp. variicola]